MVDIICGTCKQILGTNRNCGPCLKHDQLYNPQGGGDDEWGEDEGWGEDDDWGEDD
jgi:hypothetical protein